MATVCGWGRGGEDIAMERNIVHFSIFLAELVIHQERVESHSKGISCTLNEFRSRFQTMIEEHNELVRIERCKNLS